MKQVKKIVRGTKLIKEGSQPGKNKCVLCKGTKMLCGKKKCPILAKINLHSKYKPLDKKEMVGSSPPSVFVGRIGYPNVFIGPMLPSEKGDTSMMDLPEQWFGKSIEEIADFRIKLVRGMHRVNVKGRDKIIDKTREISLSGKSVDSEMNLLKKPRRATTMSDEVQPFGASAPLKNFEIDNTYWNRKMEKCYYDTDLKAKNAVITMHEKKVPVSSIQKAFSLGSFGIEKNRKLVPTRWSITAVDDMLSKRLRRNVKRYPMINEYRVYESKFLDNRFEILMMPERWSYESMETWYPGTLWNKNSSDFVLYSDYESYKGRTTYAKIGGCYYSARLAVLERLEKERRQATVIVMREAHPGYIMPVGVWHVRENVRNAMKNRPLKFDTLEKALLRVKRKFEIPLNFWTENSDLLEERKTQKKLTEWT
ncbi:MAG: Nre family DNA repair protein [Euryarchaeota archaeon]|nr:Nre family DNA repair protein [Euryarchaeota archaeon]